MKEIKHVKNNRSLKGDQPQISSDQNAPMAENLTLNPEEFFDGPVGIKRANEAGFIIVTAEKIKKVIKDVGLLSFRSLDLFKSRFLVKVSLYKRASM